MVAIIIVLLFLLIRSSLSWLKSESKKVFVKKEVENKTDVKKEVSCNENIRHSLIEYLESIEFKFYVDSEDDAIRFGISGENENLNCQIKVNEEKQYYTISTYLPFEFPDSKLYQVMETILRINEYLILGNFNLSYEYRSIYFTTAIISGGNLSNLVIEKSLRSHFGVVDDFIPSFKNVILNNQAPIISVMETVGYN